MPFSEPCFTLSVSKLGAIILGTISMGLMILSFFVPHEHEWSVIGIGYVICAGACCLWMRAWFAALSQAWRSAFDMGREVGREERSGVVPMR